MKKVFTLTLSLLMALVSWAQTTIEDAVEIVIGEDNTYENTTGTSTVAYWKYTATEDVVLETTALNYSNITGVFVDEDGTQTTAGRLSLTYPTYGFALYAGETIYVSASGSSTSIGFTADVEALNGLGKGLSEDDPLTIVPGETHLSGDRNNTSYSSAGSTCYSTYTATEDGQLVFYYDSSVKSFTANGTSYSATYDSGKYVVKVTVREDETYSFVTNTYYSVLFYTELTHPTEGSADMPFELVEGENTVPADYGVYYYTYTPTQTGYGHITSDYALSSGGQVNVYTSLSNITYSNVYAKSSEGSYEVRFELQSTSTTYYILVTKNDSSDADESFTFAYEEYEAGDQESNPIEITDDTEQTLKSASGTYYYSYTVPADTHKWLTAAATSEITSSSTYVYIYPKGSYNTTSGNSSARVEVNTTAETTYIIKWVSYESDPITFTVTLDDIEQGDLITDPIPAVLGDNDVASGTKYYTYTPTQSCKLVLQADVDMTVTFPKSTSTYGGSYSPSVSGTTYTLDVTEGTLYYIKVVNDGEASIFNLAEVEYEEGDSRDMPLDVTEDAEYVFGADVISNLWLSYEVQSNCVLVIECDATYNYQNSVYYCKSTDTYTTSMVSTDSSYNTLYKAEAAASKGDVYLVNLKMASAYEGCKVTFTERDFEDGESIDKPIILYKDSTVTLPVASNASPVWCKVTLQAGDLEIVAEGSIYSYWFASKEDAEAVAETGTTGLSSMSWDNQGWYDNEAYVYNYKYVYTETIASEGDYYMMVQRTSSEVPVTVSGDAVVDVDDETSSGISAIAAAAPAVSTLDGGLSVVADGNVKVYSLSGVKVVDKNVSGKASFNLDRGIYMVKANGKTTKIVVK